jgi:hypothetical protein
MRVLSRLAILAAVLVGLSPATASAQRWAVDWGINGGASWYSNALDDVGAANDGARFRAGALLGTQLTIWPAANIGLRANMTYTDRPFILNDAVTGRPFDDVLHGNVNLWSGSGDLLFRLRGINETWQGAETLPYVAVGLGRKWINPAGRWGQCNITGEGAIQCMPLYVAPNSTLAMRDPQNVWMGLVGIGADFRMSPRTSLRLEVNDRIYRPEIYRATAMTPGTGTLAAENIGRTVHEIGAQLGLHFLLGLRVPPPLAVAPLPPPPPPAAPPPPPAPAPPREDAITVCVIDPTATGGIRMQTATFRHAQGDTIVMVDGQARPISQVVGTGVRTARGADWYVRGQPIELTVGRETIRFLPYQTATRIEPARIVYVGNVGGFPVYADRDEIADVLPALQTARGTRTDMELGTLLTQVDARTRDVVQRATFMYVPMDPYNCVFQPLQRVEDVRKGK